MKKIKENEPFEMGGQIWQYTLDNGKIQLLRSSKKVKKEFIPPSLQEVVDFFNVKGYTTESATAFYNYYSTLDWKDKNNTPVKNWKAKALSVWFKEEAKIKPNTPTLPITNMIR